MKHHTWYRRPAMTVDRSSLDEFSTGVLVGLLVGEGHFGGDGHQPQITLRMHVRHEKIFRWLERTIPQGRLYGPYKHGGRTYFQWMIRGSYLRDSIAPLLAERIAALDDYAAERFFAMCERYRISLSDAGTKSPG